MTGPGDLGISDLLIENTVDGLFVTLLEDAKVYVRFCTDGLGVKSGAFGFNVHSVFGKDNG